MIHFRCANDVFGYCSGKPTPGQGVIKFLNDGQQVVYLSCKLSPKTCGKYLTNTELARAEGVPDPTRKRTHRAKSLRGG